MDKRTKPIKQYNDYDFIIKLFSCLFKYKTAFFCSHKTKLMICEENNVVKALQQGLQLNVNESQKSHFATKKGFY